jgi:VWFA-related protein
MKRVLALSMLLAVLSPTVDAVNGRAQPTFRSRTAGVRVDVLVTRSGRPITGLAVADFELLDNGVPQTIQSVDLEAAPVHVMLALDISASLSGSRLPTLIRASQTMVDQLIPADRVTLLTFQRRLQLLAHDSPDRVAVRDALGRMRSGGATSLRDATYAGLMLPTASHQRPLLLVFTDGRDAGSWLSPGAVLEAAEVSNAVTYGVILQDEDASLEFLEQVTEATGGRIIRAARNDLDLSFQAVLAEFRARYLLTYSPTDVAPGWHSIEVRVRRGGGEVRARRGYLAREGGGSGHSHHRH